MNAGIVVFAHGSCVEAANEAVRAAARELARAGGFEHVETAFLELGEPGLSGAVDRLTKAGIRRVLVLPYFLTLGLHLERDLPRIVGEIQRDHENLDIRVAPPLEGHPALVEILLDRVRAQRPA
ncbi:MAG: CbiX/SirB N-terminal domain-containing protein [Bryobacteraceae bacterium]